MGCRASRSARLRLCPGAVPPRLDTPRHGTARHGTFPHSAERRAGIKGCSATANRRGFQPGKGKKGDPTHSFPSRKLARCSSALGNTRSLSDPAISADAGHGGSTAAQRPALPLGRIPARGRPRVPALPRGPLSAAAAVVPPPALPPCRAPRAGDGEMRRIAPRRRCGDWGVGRRGGGSLTSSSLQGDLQRDPPARGCGRGGRAARAQRPVAVPGSIPAAGDSGERGRAGLSRQHRRAALCA